MTPPEPPVAPPAQLVRLQQRLETMSKSRLFMAVATPLFALYLVTATWSYPLINDTFTNSVTAWNIATHGSVFLEDHEVLVDYYSWWAWIESAGESAASQYPPGTALVAVPLYALWPEEAKPITFSPEEIPERFHSENQGELTFLLPPVAPAAISAALTTAVAMGLLAIAFVHVGGSVSMALVAAYLAGLGTSAWPVASGELWQHGPAMAWIALGLVLSDRHLVGSGFAFGAAVLTRPPLAVVAAATGVFRAFKARSVRPAMLVGLGALVGLVAFIGYNWWVFDSPSLSAGYGTSFQDRAGSGFGLSYIQNLLSSLLALEWGLFVWSPFLLVLLPGLRAGWKAAPPWARGAALGGVLYLLIQYKANRASGGNFLGYRYPLEALTAAAPVLFLSYKEYVAKRPSLKRSFVLAVLVSLVLQAIAAVDIGVF